MIIPNPVMHEKFYSPWCLGAPLYMPAHRHDLIEIANGEKNQQLRSMIFCTEDAVAHTELESSLRHLGLCLQGFRSHSPRFRYIRARNPEVLARLLDLPHIEKIDGFVLPKFNLQVFDAYFDQLKNTGFKVMPTLETREVFDHSAMIELRAALLDQQIYQQIAMLRIGGNDLMNILGIRRPRHLTVYDTPLGHLIAQLVTIFKPYGFALSAPVFEFLAEERLLLKEIQLDLAHGLIGKTAIHPSQIPIIEGHYSVAMDDFEMAESLLQQDVPAIFKMHDTMCEVATHRNWAENIRHRHQCYGLQETPQVNSYAEFSF